MPTTSPGAVREPPSARRAMPKSISFARGSPSSVTWTFCGLDVAMDDTARVSVVERLAEVGADLCDLAVAERAFTDELGQGRAVDQLGDQQRVAVLLAHLVEGDDAWVVEAGGGLRLAQHPPAHVAPRLDRLDRDRPLEPAVPSLVDDAEPAAADSALDQEAVEHERADQSLLPLRRAGALLRGEGSKTQRLLRVLTRRPRQRSYFSAQSTSFRRAVFLNFDDEGSAPPHPSRGAGRGRRAVPSASRS